MFKKLTAFSICMIGLGILGLTQTAVLAEENKEVPPPGKINFVAKNKIATANGTFKQWEFTKAIFDPADHENAEVVISVDVASIDTQNGKRDDHLRTPDFFDVAIYPTATLRFYDFRPTSSGKSFTSKLDFDLHGVKKTYAKFIFKLLESDPVKIEGKFTINRSDFNIGAPKSAMPMSIQELVPITFSATLPE